MKAQEVKYLGELSEQIRSKINSIFAAPTSFDQLLHSWLTDSKHSLKICEGLDDEIENSDCVCLVLSLDNSEIAEIYFDKEDVCITHPGYESLSAFVRKENGLGRSDLDENLLEVWERSLGFKYSEALAGTIAGNQALVPYIMAHVNAAGAEVEVRKSNRSDDYVIQDCREEIENEGINIDQLLTIFSTIHGEENEQSSQHYSCGHTYIRTDISFPIGLARVL